MANAERVNLIKDINMNMVKEIPVKGEFISRQKFDFDHPYPLECYEIKSGINEKTGEPNAWDSIVLNNPNKGQVLTLRQVASFYHESTLTAPDETMMVGEDKIIPNGKGIRVRKVLDETKGMPTSIVFKDAKTFQGASEGYVTKGDATKIPAKLNAYKGHGIDPKGDFVLLVPKNRTVSTTDHKSWRKANATIVQLVY